MPARVKLKGIDGGPHKRWSMWFNSMIREEDDTRGTLPGLDIYRNGLEIDQPLADCKQVLHGCRQLVL